MTQHSPSTYALTMRATSSAWSGPVSPVFSWWRHQLQWVVSREIVSTGALAQLDTLVSHSG